MKIDTPKTLGLRVRDQRLMLRMSQAELADRIGASRSWVYRMERGNRGAEIDLVLKALHALGLMMDVRGTDTPAADPPNVLDLAAILDRARGGTR